MAQNRGLHMIISATILGGCVLGTGLLLSGSMDRATEQFSGIQVAMASIKGAIEKGSVQAARTPAAAPRRGPDPSRVYKINIAGAASKGPKNAPVTLVEFSDFQCPFCSRVTATLKQVQKEYGDKVKIVFKHMPLSFHPKAPAAHAAAEAAGLQGKFWEMHDKIFGNQREMSEAKYEEWAGEIGLDVKRFKTDLASEKVKNAIARDKSDAGKLGLTGTPAFFINGYHLSGAKPFEEFKKLIDRSLGS